MKDKKPKATLVITKKLFIEVISALKKQSDHDSKCTDAFNIILPEDRVVGYDNNIIMLQLITLLKLSFKDDSDWIDYYIYEIDFGRDYVEGCVLSKEKKPIPLATPSDLWNLLQD